MLFFKRTYEHKCLALGCNISFQLLLVLQIKSKMTISGRKRRGGALQRGFRSNGSNLNYFAVYRIIFPCRQTISSYTLLTNTYLVCSIRQDFTCPNAYSNNIKPTPRYYNIGNVKNLLISAQSLCCDRQNQDIILHIWNGLGDRLHSLRRVVSHNTLVS